ncbi:hypothetical protein HZ326_23805 [Fusarium oxysporum f. sp. albedinis]|nr:hypothetical protein HZ326_23805 [Fusarium oxysporum f. sp. albedinis]
MGTPVLVHPIMSPAKPTLGCPDSKNQSLPPLAKIIKDKCLGIFFQQSSAVSLSASAAFTYFGYEAHSHALRFRSSGPFAPRLTPVSQPIPLLPGLLRRPVPWEDTIKPSKFPAEKYHPTQAGIESRVPPKRKRIPESMYHHTQAGNGSHDAKEGGQRRRMQKLWCDADVSVNVWSPGRRVVQCVRLERHQGTQGESEEVI